MGGLPFSPLQGSSARRSSGYSSCVHTRISWGSDQGDRGESRSGGTNREMGGYGNGPINIRPIRPVFETIDPTEPDLGGRKYLVRITIAVVKRGLAGLGMTKWHLPPLLPSRRTNNLIQRLGWGFSITPSLQLFESPSPHDMYEY